MTHATEKTAKFFGKDLLAELVIKWQRDVDGDGIDPMT